MHLFSFFFFLSTFYVNTTIDLFEPTFMTITSCGDYHYNGCASHFLDFFFFTFKFISPLFLLSMAYYQC